MQIKHEIVCPQWDDQRPEKAIKEVCLSINGLLNTKNDLSLRWTGCLTETLLSKSHGCSLISWMTGQFLPSAMYKTSNFWKGNFTSQSMVSHIYVLSIFFFLPAHSHISASYEALRINRTLHTLCKHNSISTLSCLLLLKWNIFMSLPKIFLNVSFNFFTYSFL